MQGEIKNVFWMDYTVESGYNKFRVKGDESWPNEVMDKGLYKPGDVYIVREDGWLYKTDQLYTLLKKYEEGKTDDNGTSERN